MISRYRYTGTTFNEGWGIEKMTDDWQTAGKWEKCIRAVHNAMDLDYEIATKGAVRLKPFSYGEAAEQLIATHDYKPADIEAIRAMAKRMDLRAS